MRSTKLLADNDIDIDIPNQNKEHAEHLDKLIIGNSRKSLLMFTSPLEIKLYDTNDMRDAYKKSIENGLEYIRIILDGTNKQKMPKFTDFAKKTNREEHNKIFKIYMLKTTIEDYSQFYIHDKNGNLESYFHFYVSDKKRTRIEKEHNPELMELGYATINAKVNFNNESGAEKLTDCFNMLKKMKLCTIV